VPPDAVVMSRVIARDDALAATIKAAMSFTRSQDRLAIWDGFATDPLRAVG
jgi:hypothetical protein